MGTQYHIHYKLETIERALIDNTYDELFLTVDDRPVTRKELVDVYNECLNKGYTVLPPCDNVDETIMSNEVDIICDTCHHENHVDLDTVNIMNIECEECGENVFEFRREHG
jgi:hypothetical protein